MQMSKNFHDHDLRGLPLFGKCTARLIVESSSAGRAMTKIAILLTCNDESEFARQFPDDAECFRTILEPHRPDWTIATVPVFQGIFPQHATDYDGYVITGSPASVYDTDPWIPKLMELIQAIHKDQVPLVGCCFGHQAIAHALGGEVSRNDFGWGLGISQTKFVGREEWMEPFAESLGLYAAHSEQVSRLPSGARILGTNADCPFAAITIGNHIMTTEYHPEMTPEFIRALVGHMSPRLEEEVVEAALAQLDDEADGELFAGWMANFLDCAMTSEASERAAA